MRFRLSWARLADRRVQLFCAPNAVRPETCTLSCVQLRVLCARCGERGCPCSFACVRAYGARRWFWSRPLGEARVLWGRLAAFSSCAAARVDRCRLLLANYVGCLSPLSVVLSGGGWLHFLIAPPPASTAVVFCLRTTWGACRRLQSCSLGAAGCLFNLRRRPRRPSTAGTAVYLCLRTTVYFCL